jgi:non-ribosomal peptide synthetase component F
VSNIKDIYGLAPLQKGMLFHHLQNSKHDPYWLVTRLRFANKIALQNYAEALQVVIDRHDILRTAFMWDGLGEPAQIVCRKAHLTLTELKMDDIKGNFGNETDPPNYMADLTHAPLLRLNVAPERDGTWIGTQLTHHLLIDHYTLEVMTEEIEAIFLKKLDALLTPVLFRKLVAQSRSSATEAEHIQFFKKMLKDVEEPTLPFGLSDNHLRGSDVSQAECNLSQELSVRLRAQARRLEVTVASICHLAFARFLACSSGRECVVFGTVLLCRSQDGERSEVSFGPWMNTLPIRLDINQTSVKEAVCKTQEQLSALLTHEHAPLALAQRCSSIAASQPLFSALFNYRHNQRTDATYLPGISVLDNEERTNYPLSLSVDDYGSSIGLTAQVIAPISADRVCAYMREALSSLVDALVHKPLQEIQTIAVIPPCERKLLLHTWNKKGATVAPCKHCIHQLFEEQVESDRQAIAIEFEGKTMSYEELNTKANMLAHYLRWLGVEPETRVALCMARSPSVIVAMLGILKAGGAFVPLDPVYSGERLNYILNDAAPMYLLVDAVGKATLDSCNVQVIDLDQPLPCDSRTSNLQPNKLNLTPANLAYVMYTSGSTGDPKGVMVEHQQVTKLFHIQQEMFHFNKFDRSCLYNSISFDVSVWEIWGALFHGGQLSIVPHHIGRSPELFYEWVCKTKTTLLCQTPTAFNMFVHAKVNSVQRDRLRLVILGGEALNPSALGEWFKLYSAGSSLSLLSAQRLAFAKVSLSGRGHGVSPSRLVRSLQEIGV